MISQPQTCFFISFLFIAPLYVLTVFIIHFLSIIFFLPLLIGTLIKEERYGWLVSLFVFIFVPTILIYFFQIHDLVFYPPLCSCSIFSLLLLFAKALPRPLAGSYF